MKFTQYILKNITLLNLGLLAVAAALLTLAFAPLMTDSSFKTPPPETLVGSRGLLPQANTTTVRPPAYTDYVSIADQNLFHPMRQISVAKNADQALPKPDVILYGTLITDSLQIAYVEDKNTPRTTPGRGKRQIAMRRGEMLSSYVLKEIDKDRIELVRGDDKITVYLSSQKKERSGETTQSASAPGPNRAIMPIRSGSGGQQIPAGKIPVR